MDDVTRNEDSMSAFNQWFANNFDALVRSCRELMPNVLGYTASDAVKSAYADVLKSPPADPIECPAAFLKLVAWRKYCQRVRKKAQDDASRPRVARVIEVDDPTSEQLSAKDTISFLRNNLTAIEQVVVQSKLDGLTNSEVAVVLSDRRLVEGCGEEQVRTIWRGLVRRWRQPDG